jgi:1,4-dihydroxy-2-naphthoate octaprenyltransferase
MYNLKIVRLIGGFFQLANPKIWVASVIPMILGGAAAYKETGHFFWFWFIASVFGIFLIETGKHAINEAVDYYTGVDRFVAANKQTPFSGGRRTIVDGKLSLLEVSIIGLLTMGAAALVGLYIVVFREPSVIWIGLAGFLIATFYTLPPLKFIYNGLGEIAVGITYGPLIVLGTYLVQTHSLSFFPLLVSIPIGVLITNVLWINQFPDYEADKMGNKRNWVVRLGKRRSLYIFAALFLISYLYIVFLALYIHKSLLLISVISIPVAIKASKIAFECYDDIPKLIKSNAGTIQVYLLTGLLMAVSVLV